MERTVISHSQERERHRAIKRERDACSVVVFDGALEVSRGRSLRLEGEASREREGGRKR